MTKKWLIFGAILIAEAFLVHSYTSNITAAGMYLFGQSSCSFRQSWNSATWGSQFVDLAENMTELSRPVEEKEGMQLWTTPHGEFWFPKGGVPALFGTLAELDMGVYGLGSQGVQAGDVVIDCGADIGMYTRLALKLGASLVISVEPAPEKKPCLENNFKQEIAEGRVRIYPKGVWDKEEVLPLYGVGSGQSVVSHKGQQRSTIQLTTIDKMVYELRLERVDFIKMDIEGAEVKALEGARQTILRFKPAMSISAEHSVAEAKEVTSEIKSIDPTYVIENGPCLLNPDRIHPHVLYMHPSK